MADSADPEIPQIGRTATRSRSRATGGCRRPVCSCPLIRTIRVRWPTGRGERTTRDCRCAVALDVRLPVARYAWRSTEASTGQVTHIDANSRIACDRGEERRTIVQESGQNGHRSRNVSMNSVPASNIRQHDAAFLRGMRRGHSAKQRS
jgi:hypothetical protein